MPKLKPGQGGGGSSTNVIPSGQYPIALVWFKRQTAKNDSRKEYIRGKYEVCAGPLKGQAFFANTHLDTFKEGTARRWMIWMESVGCEEEWEMGSHREGNAREGDDNIRRIFVGRGFVAKVRREQSGQYENNDIEQFVFLKNWTEIERDMIEAWEKEWDEKHASNPEDSAGAPPEDGPPTGGYDEYDSFEPGAGTYDPNDDGGDLPPGDIDEPNF